LQQTTDSSNLEAVRAVRLQLEQEKLAIAQEKRRALQLRNEEKELALEERRKRLTGKVETPEEIQVPKRAKGESEEAYQFRMQQYEVTTQAEQRAALIKYEQENGLALAPSMHLPGTAGEYDMDHERTQEPQFRTLVAYCSANPEYVPSNKLLFKGRARRLGIDISHLSFMQS
jgi:hypothetical protein